MSHKKFFFLLTTSIIISFTYGVATVQYKLAPYETLLNIKNTIMPALDPDLAYSDYFHHRTSFFQQHGTNDYDVVFIGDSLIDSAEWGDLFPAIKIANRGIGGDRTDGILRRMDSIYSTNARKAFIMIGINDLKLGREIDEVINNYNKIISGLQNQDMQVYVQSTLLTGDKESDLNNKIIVLNKALKIISDRDSTITYIDLNSKLAENAVLDTAFSRDGTHLNGNGYLVWKKLINTPIYTNDDIN